MGPFDFCTTPRSGASPAIAESAFATGAEASLAGFEQPARNAPADAAIIVRPKLRLVKRVGAWFSEFEFEVLQDVHPFETQLPQSISFLSDDSRIFFIVILIKIIWEILGLLFLSS
jgi:hypothetical protein